MHPIFATELARDRQARYRAEAGRSRLARPAEGSRRTARTGRTDPDRAA
ncbi:MAG TPA: hypothetical protein VH914_18205 [Acidimicrobiia bacterium]|jgi:hypothetical protein|nr:hypothetical protein [Acidimicrobiia bacterium]